MRPSKSVPGFRAPFLTRFAGLCVLVAVAVPKSAGALSPAESAQADSAPRATGKESEIGGERTFDEDLVIEAGDTLTIKAGATLRFKPRAGIVCRGRIDAAGTEESPVTFSATDGERGWANIVLIGPGANGSRFVSCRFRDGRGRTVAFDQKLTFTRILADNADDGVPIGGALLMCAARDVEIRGCRFEGNRSGWGGGAIACWDGTAATIEGCLFRGNQAGEDGGAIHCVGKAAPVIRGNVFVENTAQFGGAIHCLHQSSPRIEGNVIVRNKATRSGGGISLYNRNEPVISGNLIADNTAALDAGGIGAVKASRPRLRGNSIDANTDSAGKGKGLWVYTPEEPGVQDGSTCDDEHPADRETVLASLRRAGTLRWLAGEDPDGAIR